MLLHSGDDFFFVGHRSWRKRYKTLASNNGEQWVIDYMSWCPHRYSFYDLEYGIHDTTRLRGEYRFSSRRLRR